MDFFKKTQKKHKKITQVTVLIKPDKRLMEPP